jgi:hypothetical protein
LQALQDLCKRFASLGLFCGRFGGFASGFASVRFTEFYQILPFFT